MSRALLTLFAVLGLPASAWAAGGGGEVSSESLKILALGLLQLLILGGVIWRFGREPIRSFLFQRSEAIRDKLEASQRELAQAQEEIARLNQRLGELGREAQELIALSERQATGERERMEQRARETAERLRSETQRVADVEVQRARQLLRAEAATLATSMAADMLRGELGSEDDARLIQEFTVRLEETTH